MVSMASSWKLSRHIKFRSAAKLCVTPGVLILIGIVCGRYLLPLQKCNNRCEHHIEVLQVKERGNGTIDELREKVRILCIILTGPISSRQRAIFVRETWGKRCNILLFMASYADNELPTVALPSPEGWNVLWNKTKESFKHVFQNYEGQYDWVLKADDDTYTIVENLRFFLKDFDPRDSIIFGDDSYVFTYKGKQTGFMHGGSGYVLSREAARRFVSEGIIKKACDDIQEDTPEDGGTTVCTKKLGTALGKTHDGRDRSRYIGPLSNETFAQGAGRTFRLDFNRYSDTPIGFHLMSTSDMVKMEYALYHVRVEGAPSRFL